MIATLRGEIIQIEDNALVVEIGGVGLRVFGGHGADMDIIVASAKAYINAVNKLIIAQTEGLQPVHNDFGVMLG